MVLEKVKQMLSENFPDENISPRVDERNIVTLSGECSDWNTLIQIGHKAAAVEGVRNVVSEMTAKGVVIPERDYGPFREAGERIGVIREADVVIVGAGISGCGIARELSRYPLNIVVVERGNDVASGASRANNGCIHHGQECKSGTLKARLNVEGNRGYRRWEKELDLNVLDCGALQIIQEEGQMPELKKRYETALRNDVEGAKILTPEETRELEPGLAKTNVPIYAALWLPTQRQIEPYETCVALAENAAVNGVEFLFGCEVGDVLTENGETRGVVTNQGIIKAPYVINAAGVYADDIAKMAGDQFYTIHGRKGTIVIMDKAKKPSYPRLVSQLTPEYHKGKNVESKGGGMHPTPHMNLLLGPSAAEVPDKEDNSTTKKDLDYTMTCNQDPNVTNADAIRIFAGVRPADFKEDFIVEMSELTDGFVHVAAIQSPGLASAPAIAKRVVRIVTDDYRKKGKNLIPKADFVAERKACVRFNQLSHEEQDALIQKDSRYGNIICRCEQISEGEILDAMRSPVPPRSVDAIKHRTRAGMGRCQGGFCQIKVIELLAREFGTEWTQIHLRGEDSPILLEKNRKEAEKGR
ncbi:MAG: NAD(P)/FAD-dependent oxidoreductase [Lachnospiraceae bacterium]|nr:NAD(P)/FAD-dependent oxidoreductase [Lachnospiraceae bacterium]